MNGIATIETDTSRTNRARMDMWHLLLVIRSAWLGRFGRARFPGRVSVDEGLLAMLMPATTGAAGGIGGQPLPLEAIIGGLLIVALPYAIAVVIAARRGALGTGRDEVRTEPGPPSSTMSVHAALTWLAERPERRSVVLTGTAGRHAALEPSGGDVALAGFDGTNLLEPRDVRPMIEDISARRLLAADLERLVGGVSGPIVLTFELITG